MEPVPNREFLLDYINSHNRINSRNIINNNNDYNILNNLVRNRAERGHIDLIYTIYYNHLINNYIYSHGGQAAAAAAEAVEPVVAIESVASALSTFERFNIDVEHHVVLLPSQAQASSQHCHGDGDGNARCSICLKCLNAEQEEDKEEEDKEEEDKEEEDNEKEDKEKEVVKTKCAHIFHSKCLAKWVIQKKTTCPMCRSSLKKN